MKFYFAKTPGIIQKIFSDYTWKIAEKKDKSLSQSREIYLTFDDGPIPEITPWVLNTLEKYQAKATFFCVGDNIQKHPAIFQELLEKGHGIGNHTFNHLNGWKTSNETYFENIEKTEKAVRHSKLFRPPYGKIKISQAKALINKGYKIIMWDVLSADYDQNISPEECLQNVINNAQNGSIVVFHDHVKAFENLKYALPKTLAYFIEKGYEFKAL